MYANNFISNQVSENNFEIINVSRKVIKKFNAETSDYAVKFKNIPTEFVDSIFYMNDIMILIVNKLIESVGRRDKIKIIINHPVLSDIEFPFMFAKDLNSDLIMSEISKCVQSNKILTLDNNMTFHTLVMHYLTGGGHNSVKRLDNFLFKKQTIIRISTNKNNKLCAL